MDVNKLEEKIGFEPFSEESVDFDTFCKTDLRAVKVIRCEAPSNSRKLLQFTLDDGSGKERTICSGLRAYYEPEELTGKTLAAVINLPARKMAGLMSEGMLLTAEYKKGEEECVRLIVLDDSIPAGAKIC